MRFTLFVVIATPLMAIAEVPTVVEVPQPPLAKWTEFKAATGRQLVLDAKASAKWVAVDDGCDLTASIDGKTATFSAPTPGRYRVVCVVAGEPVRLAVTVGGALPPDPPKPPDPPPVNLLVADLRAALLADKGAVADMQALSALYTLMVTEAGKSDYLTAADLNGRFVAARDTMLKGTLPSVRKRAGAEVAAVIGTDPTAALTDDLRVKVAAVYGTLAKAVAEAAK